MRVLLLCDEAAAGAFGFVVAAMSQLDLKHVE